MSQVLQDNDSAAGPMSTFMPQNIDAHPLEIAPVVGDAEVDLARHQCVQLARDHECRKRRIDEAQCQHLHHTEHHAPQWQLPPPATPATTARLRPGVSTHSQPPCDPRARAPFPSAIT